MLLVLCVATGIVKIAFKQYRDPWNSGVTWGIIGASLIYFMYYEHLCKE